MKLEKETNTIMLIIWVGGGLVATILFLISWAVGLFDLYK